jgi:plasmid stabilization system protein ParE
VVSKVIWSPRALSDLGEIARFISIASPMAAEKFCLRVIEHAETLGQFPHKGRVVPEKQRENLRELVFPPYRIAYEVQFERGLIEIMTIWHSARGAIDL